MQVTGKNAEQGGLPAPGCALDERDAWREWVREVVDHPIRLARVTKEEMVAGKRTASARRFGRQALVVLNSYLHRLHWALESLTSLALIVGLADPGATTARSVWPSSSR